MKIKLIFLALLSCPGFSSFCQTYISDVTLVDVLHQKLVPHQTVIINKGVILDIGPSNKIKTPVSGKVINGKGKFLLPGMTDAHVHFFQSGGLYTRPDAIDLRKYQPYEKEIEWVHNNMEDLLRRYVKAGITSVIDVGSNYHFLQQRDSFENKSYAPHIYMTGPLLTSYEPGVFKNLKDEEPFMLVKTPADGVKGVDLELPYHPDFIKIWYIVNSNKDSIDASARKFEPVVKAIIEEAHKNHLKVAVHATQRITAQLAVESGCDYLVHGVDDEIVTNDFIQLLKTKKVILCPTLIVEDGYFKTFAQNMHYSSYDSNIANPQQLASIQNLENLPDTTLASLYKKRFNMPAIQMRLSHEDSVRTVNLKNMADAGVTIAAGTDAGNIGTQHASSYFDELLAMRQSGLSNWQIIRAATINPARILNKEDSFGSITIGKKADMVLLNADPVDDLQNITDIHLVINKGVVIDPATLSR
jgi:imidazolonepropionase-like amidohydrolase